MRHTTIKQDWLRSGDALVVRLTIYLVSGILLLHSLRMICKIQHEIARWLVSIERLCSWTKWTSSQDHSNVAYFDHDIRTKAQCSTVYCKWRRLRSLTEKSFSQDQTNVAEFDHDIRDTAWNLHDWLWAEGTFVVRLTESLINIIHISYSLIMICETQHDTDRSNVSERRLGSSTYLSIHQDSWDVIQSHHDMRDTWVYNLAQYSDKRRKFPAKR